MIEIKRLSPETLELLYTIEDRRLDSERVVIRPKQGGFALDYKPLPGALWRVGNAERDTPTDMESWLDSPDRAVYLAWLNGTHAGQMLIEAYDHSVARVRDIRVAMPMRRNGIGEAMLSLAEDWARARKLSGLLAETQDVNAGACQFFSQCGFELGGVDMLRYVARSQQTMMAVGLRESALFFYRFWR